MNGSRGLILIDIDLSYSMIYILCTYTKAQNNLVWKQSGSI